MTENLTWLDSDYFNQSAFARALNISPQLFGMKKKGVNRNKFTDEELRKLEQIKNTLHGLTKKQVPKANTRNITNYNPKKGGEK